jgi:hypothetical protein
MAAQTEILSPILDHLFCTRCATPMSLVRIFPERPGYDQRSYECSRCKRVITVVIEFPEIDGVES